jgi:hypothetical protein
MSYSVTENLAAIRDEASGFDFLVEDYGTDDAAVYEGWFDGEDWYPEDED